MTYYDVLGVPYDAEPLQIKKAYRDQIRFFHPDVFEGSEAVAHIKAEQLNEAYEILSNPQKRAQYDYHISMNKQAHTPPNTSEPVKEKEQPEPKSSPQADAAKSQKPNFRIPWKILAELLAFVILCVIGVLSNSISSTNIERTINEILEAILLLITVIAMGAAGWFLGNWCWAQIIRSAQNIDMLESKAVVRTVVMWASILIAATLLVALYFTEYLIVYLLGLGAALVRILVVEELL